MDPWVVLLAISPTSSRTDFAIDLRKKGFQVLTADNGLECVSLLRRLIPGLLIIEPELPWGGGDGVLAAFGDTLQVQGVPVLVLSSDNDHSALYRISQFHVSDLLQRPVTPQQLTARVAKLVVGLPSEIGGRRNGPIP